MSNTLPPPPERPGLGNTFKRPISLLQIGDPNGPGLVIGSPVPTVLTNHYGVGLGIPLAQAYISIINANGDYYYEVAGVNAGTDVFFGAGVVISGVVRELFRGEAGPALATPVKASLAPDGGHVFLGSNSSGSWSAPSNNGVLIVGEWLSFFDGCDINYGGASGRSLGRGIIAVGTATGSVTGIGTALAQIMSTDVPAARYDTGRAYRMHVHIPLVVSIAGGDVIARWRETGGTVVRPQQTVIRTLAVGSIWTYDETLVFVNTSGAPITTHILVEIATTGTANLASSVSATAPGRLEIEDIGDAARFPNAPSMA